MRNNLKAWFISVFAFVLGVVATIFLGESIVPSSIYPWAENIVTVTSFVISFIAFIFSMITYFSIDVVSGVTSMDGNVLENGDYAIAYEEAIDFFKEAKTEQQFFELLMEKIKCNNKTKSCIIFADNLQDIIDYIIWFAYIDLKNPIYSKQCEEIVERITKEQKRYQKMSNGINHLLEENVKLIKYVLVYQAKRTERESDFSKLENIRGNMLKNPISQIVYFDYLGLDYRKKAASILNACGDTNQEFSAEHMRAIMNFTYSEEQKKQFACLIERAELCFARARGVADGNVLWEGYISYNQARVDLMKYLMQPEGDKNTLCENLAEIVKVRENARFLFRREGSYLDEKFAEEVERAVQLKSNFEELLQINCENEE